MQYDFLKDFTRRMKCVGLYALLYDNSSQKYIWKERGFNTLDEQLNVIFSVMLYIMEQSLKEESCTIDNITVFLDSLNERYYKKSMSYDECSDWVSSLLMWYCPTKEGQCTLVVMIMSSRR